MLINFLGPPSVPGGGGAFRIIPLADVLDGAFRPERVQDKIVLVGFTTAVIDDHPTPTTGDAGWAASRFWGTRSRRSCFSVSWSPPWPVVVGLIVATRAPRGPLRRVATAAGEVGLALLADVSDRGEPLLETGIILDLVLPPAALS